MTMISLQIRAMPMPSAFSKAPELPPVLIGVRVVYQRRTDNIMTKRKSTKGQTMICKPLHKKRKNEQHEQHELLSKPGVTQVLC
jgi:hypothetical protein